MMISTAMLVADQRRIGRDNVIGLEQEHEGEGPEAEDGGNDALQRTNRQEGVEHDQHVAGHQDAAVVAAEEVQPDGENDDVRGDVDAGQGDGPEPAGPARIEVGLVQGAFNEGQDREPGQDRGIVERGHRHHARADDPAGDGPALVNRL
jgi:hypothetical protein